MADLLAYHNPDRMGYAASNEAAVLTNKRLGRSILGCRIWLVEGVGRPRRYFLRGWFIASEIDPDGEEGFRSRISGTVARFLTPNVDITDEPWFPALRCSQGSFAFGLQTMTDPCFVAAFERLCRRR
jgi:hypothetical protein